MSVFVVAPQSQDYLPHYCNFVRSVPLHDRAPSPGYYIDDGDDDIDDGYITNNDVTLSDHE